ncbi:MAG TPA: thiamine-phosphate synthase family protein [Nitrososphaera sp.]|nr:thiamine-phosphate synthase family protein [Nitrososphaera sp.]
MVCHKNIPYERIVISGRGYISTEAIKLLTEKNINVILVDTYGILVTAIIEYMRVNPPIRSVINIRFNDELVKICKNLFSVSSYDKSKEPNEQQEKGRLQCDMRYIAGALKEPESGHHLP